MQREEKEINSPSLLVCYVRGLGDSPCDATICLGDEIYARWSVNIWGSSSFILIMDWLGEGVTTQASQKRESRKQMLTEPLEASTCPRDLGDEERAALITHLTHQPLPYF